MRRIKFFDTTLRDGEQSPGCSMNLHEKLEVAKQLEKLQVDVIEAGFAIASPDDFAAVKAIAETIKTCTVASLARSTKEDIDRAAEAVKGAVHPRIHIFLATSDIHLIHKLNMDREQVLKTVRDMVGYAKGLCDEIEFSAEDASRSDWEFLAEVFSVAIEAGATVLNVPDTVGYITPDEMRDLILYLKKHVRNVEEAEFSVHCHNDLGMAVANSMAALMAGAAQVEVAVNGIGERAGNASLEEIAMAISTRKDYYQMECGIVTEQIYRTSRLISSITGINVSPTKPVVGANAFAHEAGIHQHGVLNERLTYEIMTPKSIGIPDNKMVLGKHSGRHAFEDRLNSLGYSLNREMLDQAFQNFKVLADRKKHITDRDLEALLSNSRKVMIPKNYQVESFVVSTSWNNSPTAIIKLKNSDGDILEEIASGDGPIDAAFTAIEKIVKHGLPLEDYYIQAVTEGEDALGEVIVKIRRDDEIITGRGLSTDTIEASIEAYVNAINKL